MEDDWTFQSCLWAFTIKSKIGSWLWSCITIQSKCPWNSSKAEKKVKALREKVHRRENQTYNLKDLLSFLKQKQLIAYEQLQSLKQNFRDVAKYLFQNHAQNTQRNNPHASQYNGETKKFAMTIKQKLYSDEGQLNNILVYLQIKICLVEFGVLFWSSMVLMSSTAQPPTFMSTHLGQKEITSLPWSKLCQRTYIS